MLVGLANHAGTVRTCLDPLEAEDIISPCDPDIVAARIKRADRRPQGWDLNLSLVRHDLAAAAMPFWSISSRGWASSLPRVRSRVLTARLTGAITAPRCHRRRGCDPAVGVVSG